MPALPRFIAFTGVDDPALADGLVALSARYPIEWGILVDDDRADEQLFPARADRERLVTLRGLRWAAHVCGAQARAIADDPAAATIDLTGFARMQVNHGFGGSTKTQVGNVVAFAERRRIRALLQCQGDFPDDTRLDWLFDVSFGTGIRPDRWPAPSTHFCGYSGGIGPANAAEVVTAIAAPVDGDYWIDMESGVRTDGRFDLDKCAAVCRAVYGAR